MVGQNVYQPDEIKFILERLIAGQEGSVTIEEYQRQFGKSLTANQLRYVKNKYGKDPTYGTLLINSSMARKRKRAAANDQTTPNKKRPASTNGRPQRVGDLLPAAVATVGTQGQQSLPLLDQGPLLPPIEFTDLTSTAVTTAETRPIRPMRRARIKASLGQLTVPHTDMPPMQLPPTQMQMPQSVDLQLDPALSQLAQVQNNSQLPDEHYLQTTKAPQGPLYYTDRQGQAYMGNFGQNSWGPYPQTTQGHASQLLASSATMYQGIPSQGGWSSELEADLVQQFATPKRQLESEVVGTSQAPFISAHSTPTGYPFPNNEYYTQTSSQEGDSFVHNTLAPMVGAQLPPMQTTGPPMQVFDVLDPRSDDLSGDDQNAVNTSYQTTNMWPNEQYIATGWYDRHLATQQYMQSINERLHSSPEAAPYRPSNETGYARNTIAAAPMQQLIPYGLSPTSHFEQAADQQAIQAVQANTAPSVVDLSSSPLHQRSEHGVPDYGLVETLPVFIPSQVPLSGTSPSAPKTMRGSGSGSASSTRGTIDPRMLNPPIGFGREATFSPNTETPQTPPDQGHLLETLPKC